MENSSRNGRTSQLSSSGPLKQRRSGYEPSDTETEWQESPWLDHNWKHLDLGFGDPKTATPRNASPLKQSLSPRNPSPLKKTLSPRNASPLKQSESPRNRSPLKKTVSPRSTSPLTVNRRLASKFENNGGSSPPRRRHSKSPYKPRRDDGNRSILPPPPGFDYRRNISPFSKSERWRNISPYKAGREEQNLDQDEAESSNRKQNHLPEDGRATEKSSYTRRSATAPRQRMREIEKHNRNGNIEQRGERTPSPLSRNMVRKQREASHMKTPSIGEINEMVGNAKLSGVPLSKAPNFESTDSISPGDIFFSRERTALAMPKNVLPKNSGFESLFNSKPKMFSGNESVPQQPMMLNGSYGHNGQGISSGNGSSRTNTTSSSAVSRQFSSESSKMSNVSGRTTQSMKKFTANRRKSQTEGAWFACMRKGTCSTSKSPEHRPQFDEASFIEKAFVVEHLRPFWADKHRPGSLNGFTCHKQEAQLLKQLVSHDICPHILFKGPSGSGKKALTMALLREIYGDPSWNISHDLRYFQIQEKRTTQVVIPLTSSAHHVELNVNSEPNARYALMALVKEISNNFAITPEVSNVNFKTDYKVIVLYEVDKAAENIQHLIKWIMDCYTDSCKLILCCEDDVEILESVKTRCKVIKVDAPVTHEIMEVLIQIARKEDIDLSMSFAAKIATKSKQNLRKAIMALEACKAQNYPFVDDQPIPLGWEEVLVELGAEILANPSPNRLFFIRGKFQKLLVDFVHPKLILQKLVEQFLKGVEASLKRELYYWHAYYDKRLPSGTSALLKLEEFVAKFMSIYRKSFSNHQYM